MKIIISNSSDKPIYDQIYSQIKALIMGSSIGEGEALPSIRQLAKDLRISVITTKRAYEELERDGFIETVAGKGSFVSPKNIELVREHHLKEMENLLLGAVEIAKSSSISLEEMQTTLNMLYKEE